jgi:hypothetical protein
MILDEINSNLVEQVGKIVDKDGKFYVGEFPKCCEPLAVCGGLSAAVSTASFSSILAPAYIFNNGFFQLLVVENGEIKLGDEYDDVLYLWEKKQPKYDELLPCKEVDYEGIIIKYPTALPESKFKIVENFEKSKWHGSVGSVWDEKTFFDELCVELDDSYKSVYSQHIKNTKNCIIQTSEGFWNVNGHTYSTYEYAKQALKNSGIE